jgi:hypothetical protein
LLNHQFVKELASKAGAKIHTLISNKQAFFEKTLK